MKDTFVETMERSALWEIISGYELSVREKGLLKFKSPQAENTLKIVRDMWKAGENITPVAVAAKSSEPDYVFGCFEHKNTEEAVKYITDILHKSELDKITEITHIKDVTAPLTSTAMAMAEKLIALSAEGAGAIYSSIAESAHRTHTKQSRVLVTGDGTEFAKPTGFTKLDTLLAGGFWNSTLNVIAARPSMGKTALSLKMALNMAERGVPIGYFSLEMSETMLVIRIVSQKSGIDTNKIKLMDMNEQEWKSYLDQMAIISELPIFITDRSGMTLSDIYSTSRAMKQNNSIGAVFIDYLQLVSTAKSGNESREREVSQISQGFKKMAKDLDIPVIALAQLNREIERRVDRTPLLSDLRESGSVEQDADTVMFINRPSQYKVNTFSDGTPSIGKAEIILAKHRDGAIGDVKLGYEGARTRFYNLEENDFLPINYTETDDVW